MKTKFVVCTHRFVDQWTTRKIMHSKNVFICPAVNSRPPLIVNGCVVRAFELFTYTESIPAHPFWSLFCVRSDSPSLILLSLNL
jgi:hypothetical protein